MTKSTILLVSFALLGFSNLLRAQGESTETERSIVTIQRGINLHDEKKYDEAIGEFKKVHRNDSNFYLASLELLNSYLSINKNQEGLELCDHLLKLKNNYTPNILIFKGDFLDNLDRPEDADAIYDYGAKEYPLNHLFYYEHGIAKLKKKKYDDAYTYFVKAIKVNPFHAASHYQLGLMAYRTHNITANMLAFQFYLVCDATSKRATGAVVDLENIAKSELEVDTVVTMKTFENDNNFEELESLIKSKVALSAKYKTKLDLSYDVVKQMQLLTENIGKYPSVKGFYNEFYGKFFTELEKEKYFETFVYCALKGMKIETVDKWLVKNKSKVEKFENWAYDYVCKTFASFPENLNGKIMTVPHWYSSNSIMGAGQRNENNMNNGYWKYYYKNGIIKSEGEFLNGNKNGKWKTYYITGGLKEESVYENNKEKSFKSYYENNNPKVEIGIDGDKIAGEKKVYFSNGKIASVTPYKDGVITGTQKYYYRNGSLRYAISNTNEIINGDLVEYYDNGKIYQKVSFVNSKREGAAKTFYNNANNSVSSEGTYLKNNATGEWKTYFNSGKLKKKSVYKSEGLYDGPVIEYFENGKVNTEETYSNGKSDGLTKIYNEDGSLWEEFLYKKGKLTEYRAYKKDGGIICNNKIKGKNFKVLFYHPNGNKRREGEVSDGELEGNWKDYNSFGVLTRETNYKDGKEDGKYYEYYNNGKIRRERNYTSGTENGLYKSYFINGVLQMEGQISNGNKEGYWKGYSNTGIIKSNEYYYNDEIDGWAEYFDVNGKLTSENLNSEYCLIKIVYHDTSGNVLQNIDLPGGNGTIERKTSDGKTIFKRNYSADFPDGLSSTFYPDGSPETKLQYTNGKKEGKSVIYNPFGIILSEVNYFNDQKNGLEKGFDDDGKLESEYNLVNDDYHGQCKTYHENGKTFKELNYTEGEAEGESNLFDENGELIFSRKFHRDLLVSYTYKDTKGQFMKALELPTGETKVLCFFQNGKKSFEGSYNNGDLHGKRLIYNSNGQVIDESGYYFDSIHGESKEYYRDGKLKLVETYFYGNRDGKSKCYSPNGKLKWEKDFKQGERHGWTKYFNANGELVKSILYYNGDPVFIK